MHPSVPTPGITPQYPLNLVPQHVSHLDSNAPPLRLFCPRKWWNIDYVGRMRSQRKIVIWRHSNCSQWYRSRHNKHLLLPLVKSLPIAPLNTPFAVASSFENSDPPPVCLSQETLLLSGLALALILVISGFCFVFTVKRIVHKDDDCRSEHAYSVTSSYRWLHYQSPSLLITGPWDRHSVFYS